jgi:DNA-binding IclR family transcriptional regulator
MATPTNLSILKAFKLIQLVGRSANGLTISQLANKTEMSFPTTHRLLQTLRKVEAVHVTVDRKYRLGNGVLNLAYSNDHNDAGLRSTIARRVQSLAEELQQTVHVAISHGDMVRYVAKGESPRSLKIASRVGSDLEAYCTGVGKILLAALAPKQLKHYLHVGSMVKLTANTITDPRRLKAELATIRQRGYAIDNEEFEEGLGCIAVPVYSDGDVVAAISVSGPASRLKTANLERYCRALSQEAKEIERLFERLHLEPNDLLEDNNVHTSQPLALPSN